MSYSAKTFNVMIASPGDVSSERAIIRDVIYEWNAVNSMNRKIVLMPIGWESHSSPEMGLPPQEIINKQVLEKCDLLVGVFWTRIGTPTSNHESGTVEEIENHIVSGKPTMLYFSSQPVAMESVDIEQYKKLQQFKETCKTRGLYESYDSHSDFKDKFYRHLQLKINNDPLFFSESKELPIGEIIESSTKIPSLSLNARTLLKNTSLDPHGRIMVLKMMSGTYVQTNQQNLVESQERREVAKWESALEELVNQELIIPRGDKGEMFEITNQGYQMADMIEL